MMRCNRIAQYLAVATVLAAWPAADACIVVPAKCSVTSTFGPRYNPITKNFSTEFHHGVDFGCPLNTPVVAADGGSVRVAGYSNSAGNWVVVDTSKSHVHKYMHHERNLVTPGRKLTQGEQLALSGHTGRSTGPHLHFQVESGGVAIDPSSQFCSKPPLKGGVLDGVESATDVNIEASQATAPADGGGVPPAMGADGSLVEILTDVITARATNPDYVRQLSTLSAPRLYAELAFMQNVRLKVAQERSMARQRIEATQAMINVLLTEATLRPQLDDQRRRANNAAARR